MANLVVKALDAAEFKSMETYAHMAVFKELLQEGVRRHTFALLVVDDEIDKPVQYVTVREQDSTGASLEYGGAFPDYRGTATSWRGFQLIIDWLKERYERVSFSTANTNRPMLKFGMKAGFTIIGMRNYNGQTMLEHCLEMDKGA